MKHQRRIVRFRYINHRNPRQTLKNEHSLRHLFLRLYPTIFPMDLRFPFPFSFHHAEKKVQLILSITAGSPTRSDFSIEKWILLTSIVLRLRNKYSFAAILLFLNFSYRFQIFRVRFNLATIVFLV